MGKKNLIIFGTGEIGDLAGYYFTNDSNYNVIGYSADDSFVKEKKHNGVPLIPFSVLQKEFPPDKTDMHIALSYRELNMIRNRKYLEARDKGYKLASYVCSKSVFWNDLSIGDN